MDNDTRTTQIAAQNALRFVLLVGVLSLFADFTYEGARSVIGPYLGTLGATATIIGIVTGFGEFLGYGLRLVSGRWADVTGKFWPITIFGYLIQMASVPALALTNAWWQAALLIILERVGKAIRNPPRDVMLSYAARRMGGYGWAFGVHEALDQFGAMVGPLVVSAILVGHGSYREAFAVLLIPAVLNLSLVLVANRLYPRPEDLDVMPELSSDEGLPRVYWVYLSAASLVAAGFADYPLIAYHFVKTNVAPSEWIAIFYAIAMAVSGASSLLFGRLFDRFGFVVLLILTAVSAAFAPLVFYGHFWLGMIGAAVWGAGIGVHESIIPAAVAPMVPRQNRGYAFGLFTSAYGTAWFIGSAIIGILYDWSVGSTVLFCVSTQILALLPLLWVGRQIRTSSRA